MENTTQKEIEWKNPVSIPDGKKTGVITKIEYREIPYQYTDIFIKMDGKDFEMDFEMKYGCPTLLTENSKLGRLLIVFGETFEKDKKSSPEKVLVGKKVEFMTLTKKSKKEDRYYAEIVEDSIKPISETSEPETIKVK